MWIKATIQRIDQSIWGYDFFVSYNQASADKYASRRAEMLRKAGFDVFIDHDEIPVGGSLSRTITEALRKTQRLVVIGTKEALSGQSPWVAEEVLLFAATKRACLPILFSDSFEGAAIHTCQENARKFLKDLDKFWVDESHENLACGKPDEEKVVRKLINSQKVTARRRLRSRISFAVLCAVSTFAVFALIQWGIARAAREQAVTDSRLAFERLGNANFSAAIRAMEIEQDPILARHLSLKASAAFARAELPTRSRVAALVAAPYSNYVSRTLPLPGPVRGIHSCPDENHLAAWSQDHDDRWSVVIWNWRTGVIRDQHNFADSVENVYLNQDCSEFLLIQRSNRSMIGLRGSVGKMQQATKCFEEPGFSSFTTWIHPDLRSFVAVGRKFGSDVRPFTLGVLRWDSTVDTTSSSPLEVSAEIDVSISKHHTDLPLILVKEHPQSPLTDSPLRSLEGPAAVNRNFRLWDLRTNPSGRALGQITGAEFDAADRARLACWNEAGDVRILEIDLNKETSGIAHPGMQQARFSPDGSRLVTWNEDTLKIWDLRTVSDVGEMSLLSGPERKSETSTYRSPAKITLNRDASKIAGLSSEGAWFWPTESQHKFRLTDSDGLNRKTGICFTSDDKFISVWSDNAIGQVWEIESAARNPGPSFILRHKGISRTGLFPSFTVQPLGQQHLLTTASDELVRVWQMRARADQTLHESQPKLAETLPEAPVTDAPIATNSESLKDDLPEGTRTNRDSVTHRYSADICGDTRGLYVLSFRETESAVLWNRLTSKRIPLPFDPTMLRQLHFTPDDSVLIAWSVDGSVTSWRCEITNTPREIRSPSPSVSFLGTLAVLQDGNELFALDKFTARKLRKISHVNAKGTPVPFSGTVVNSTGTHALTWSSDGIVQWWSEAAAPFSLPHKLNDQVPILGASLSTDGRKAIVWTHDVYCWTHGNPQPQTLPIFDKYAMDTQVGVAGAAFTTSEDQVLTWDLDGFARLWDFKTGQLMQEFKQAPVLIDGIDISATLSLDRSLLLTSTDWGGKSTKLWDIKSGRLIREFDAYGGSFSKDSTELFLSVENGVRIVPLGKPSTPAEIEQELQEFEFRSATTATDSGDLRVMSPKTWQHRQQ